MKKRDVPEAALTAPPTRIPLMTQVVFDWGTLLELLKIQGFVIIESEAIRKTKAGTDESVEVKAFNSYVRTTRKLKLYTRRISDKRWFCTL